MQGYGKRLWTKEEGLTEIKAVKMIELPERKVEAGKVLVEGEDVIQRMIRHLNQSKVKKSNCVFPILFFIESCTDQTRMVL